MLTVNLYLLIQFVKVVWTLPFENLPDVPDSTTRINNCIVTSIEKTKTAVCEHITRESFENLFPYNIENLKTIMFKQSSISLLTFGSLNSYPDLTNLYINNSDVQNMQSGVFANLFNLKELHLEHNSISKIKEGVFNSLLNLEALFLNHNAINLIEEEAFIGLFKLRILDLSFNKLVHILPNIFQNLNRLKEVDFSHNMFVEVVIEFEAPIHNFDISFNQLDSFNLSMFQNVSQTLNLAHNNIHNMVTSKNVAILDISFNNLTNIDHIDKNFIYLNFSNNLFYTLTDDDLFNGSLVLQILDFSNNIIQSISNNVFQNLENLQHLLLQNNAIINVPLGCFRNMKHLATLNLSNNLITDFDYGTFTGLTSLTYLDVSKNKINFIFESALHPLKKLKVLYISDNNLKSIDANKILDLSKTLKYVSLHNNLWQCKALIEIVSTLEKRGVIVEEGFDTQNTNIHGITCKTFPEIDDYTSDFPMKNQTGMLQILQSVRKYFDTDFLKSSFVKYFESLKTFNVASNITKPYIEGIQLTDSIFENSKLYKFFTSQHKENPLSDLVKNLSNLMQNANNTKVYYTNMSDHDSLHKEFSDLKVSFQQSLSNTLDKVDGYIDRIFNNSDVFNTNYKNLIPVKQNDNFKDLEKVPEQFSAYILSNKTFDMRVSEAEFSNRLEKLEQRLQNNFPANGGSNSTVIFSVIIIILVSIVCFISFKNFVNKKCKFFRKTSCGDPTESRLNLEQLSC